jgi:hypothetical protein
MVCCPILINPYSRILFTVTPISYLLRCGMRAEKALILAGIKFANCEYAAATTILTKCLDQEFGQTNGFKPPTLDREGSSLSATDQANPWANFGGAGTATGTRASMVGDAAHKAATLIQPAKTYMDDLNHEVLGSMVS